MKGNQKSLSTVVVEIGLLAPENISTHGSRPARLTPRADELAGDKKASGKPNLQGQAKVWQAATVSCGGHRQKDGSITPKLDQQVKNWSTPKASELMRGNCPSQRARKSPGLISEVSGKLNPRWVETLMGIPLGWTCPDCPASVIRNWPKFLSGWNALLTERMNSGVAATVSCQPPPSEPSQPS